MSKRTIERKWLVQTISDDGLLKPARVPAGYGYEDDISGPYDSAEEAELAVHDQGATWRAYIILPTVTVKA